MNNKNLSAYNKTVLKGLMSTLCGERLFKNYEMYNKNYKQVKIANVLKKKR